MGSHIHALTSTGTLGTVRSTLPVLSVWPQSTSLLLEFPHQYHSPTMYAETEAPLAAVPFRYLAVIVAFEVGILSIGCVEMVMLVGPATCWNEYPYSIAGLFQKQGGYIMAGPARAAPPLADLGEGGERGKPRCRGV